MTKPRACDTGNPFRHAARPVPPGCLLNSMLQPTPGHADRQAPLKGYNKVGRSFLERLISKNGPPDFGQRPTSPERGRNAGWNRPVRKSGRMSDAQAANVPAAKYGMVKVVFLSCFFIAFKYPVKQKAGTERRQLNAGRKGTRSIRFLFSIPGKKGTNDSERIGSFFLG